MDKNTVNQEFHEIMRGAAEADTFAKVVEHLAEVARWRVEMLEAGREPTLTALVQTMMQKPICPTVAIALYAAALWKLAEEEKA